MEATRPAGSEPAAGAEAGNVPINVAPPNWQCPHCQTKYREDLEKATRCAHAGPAPDVVEGVPVLFVADKTSRTLLGRTTVGPVKPVTGEDGSITHHRLVRVAGKDVDPIRVAAAVPGRGGLRIVTSDRDAPAPRDTSPGVEPYGMFGKLFLGKNALAYGSTNNVPAWIGSHENHRRDEATWWCTPDRAQREVLNTVLHGALDRIVETDQDTLTERIVATYGPHSSRSHHLTPVSFANAKAGLVIARAHGAPNHIWAMRWLGQHLAQVTSWQARMLHQWAAGADEPSGAPVIPAIAYLPIPEKLPRNPGKRRLAVMEPYGDTYDSVRDAVLSQLAADVPTNPVPDVPDVEAAIRGRAGRATLTTPEGT